MLFSTSLWDYCCWMKRTYSPPCIHFLPLLPVFFRSLHGLTIRRSKCLSTPPAYAFSSGKYFFVSLVYLLRASSDSNFTTGLAFSDRSTILTCVFLTAFSPIHQGQSGYVARKARRLLTFRHASSPSGIGEISNARQSLCQQRRSFTSVPYKRLNCLTMASSRSWRACLRKESHICWNWCINGLDAS